MAIIIPDSQIKLLKDVPLDGSYSDTLKFSTYSEQTAYFLSKVFVSFDSCSYQRTNSSGDGPRKAQAVYVQAIAEHLFECNYLMFQNSHYTSKWYYGFIKSINYINPNTAEIIYEIDQFQTWFLACSVKPSFVEREHASNDIAFSNLAPEPFEITSYINDANIWRGYPNRIFGNLGKPYIVALCTKDTLTEGSPTMYSGVYNGLHMYSVPVSSYTDMTDFLENLGSKLDGVVELFMSPFYPDTSALSKTVDTTLSRTFNNFGGYTPHNNKLLNYPFRFIKLRSTTGEECVLRPEYMQTSTLTVYVEAVTGSNPELACIPSQYAGINPNYDYMLTTNEKLQCAWSGDLFKQWAAQNAVSIGLKAVTNTLSIAAGAAGLVIPGGQALGVGGVAAGVSGLTSLISESAKMQTLPGEAKGKQSTSALGYALSRLGFEGLQYTCNADQAQRIDQYFDMFGYAVNQVKVPNMTSRTTWNYVKTNNVIINGEAPTDAIETIKACFNNGIRFWHGGATAKVGDFTQANPTRLEATGIETF